MRRALIKGRSLDDAIWRDYQSLRARMDPHLLVGMDATERAEIARELRNFIAVVSAAVEVRRLKLLREDLAGVRLSSEEPQPLPLPECLEPYRQYLM